MKRRPPPQLVLVAVGWYLVGSAYVGAFNVDVTAPIVLTQPVPGLPADGPSYFGFSVALLRDLGDVWLLVGAPRATMRGRDGVADPGGAMYRCRVAPGSLAQACQAYLGSDSARKNFCDGANNCRTMDINENWFGVSVVARPNGNSSAMILTCGHMFRMENDFVNYTMGACVNATMPYSSSGLDHSSTVAIFNDSDTIIPTLHTFMNSTHWHLQSAMTLTGSSLHMTQDGRTLIGLPGLNYGKGGVFIDQNCEYPFNPVSDKDREIYVGYSVTSVRMNNGTWYVAGGPRYGIVGKVVLFRVEFYTTPVKSDSDSMCNAKNTKAVYELSGDQRFSYYGAAVYGVDVNGDGNDDLLVGAPYYNKSRGDEGVVFVYLSNGTGYQEQWDLQLTGGMISNARFGSSIASIDDINLDNYNDVVVGAPYDNEGRGAVYIYLGSSNGLSNNYAQRLTPTEFGFGLGSRLMRFGRSLSGRVDVDSNVYPDLAVGAADAVVLLRTRPVHDVDVQIQFNDTVIRWQRPGKSCSGLVDLGRLSNVVASRRSQQHHQQQQPMQGDNVKCEDGSDVVSGELRDQLSQDTTFCLSVTVVFNYSAPDKDALRANSDGQRKLVKAKIKGVRYVLHVDKGEDQPRGFLIRRNSRCDWAAGSVSADITFGDDVIRRPAVDQWIVLFPKMPKNVDARIRIQLDLDGTVENEVTGGYIPDRIELRDLSPVLDPRVGKQRNFSADIAFERNCGADDICQPDLRLHLISATPVTIGQPRSHVEVEFAVTNDGEVAISNWISIDLPSSVQFSSSSNQVSCTLKRTDVSQLFHVHCESDRPLFNATSPLSFRMTFDFENEVTEEVVKAGGPSLISNIGTGRPNDTRGPFTWNIPATYNSQLRVASPPNTEMKVSPTEFQQDSGKAGSVSSGQTSDGNRMITNNVTHVIHRFEVVNMGNGSMPQVVVDVRLPFENSSLVVVNSVSVTTNPYPCGTTIVCQRNITGNWIDDSSGVLPARELSSSISARQRKRRSSNPDEENESSSWWDTIVGSLTTSDNLKFLNLTCEDLSMSPCRIARFSAGTLQPGDSLNVTINVTIRLSLWLKLKDVGALTYTSTVIATPGKLDGLSMENMKHIRHENLVLAKNLVSAKTSTKIISKRIPVPMPSWVLILSIGMGLVGLIICIIILKRIGFFNRHQHNKMMREKRESARLPLSDDEILDACLENNDNDGGMEEKGRPEATGFLCVDNNDLNGRSSRDPSEYDNEEADAVPSLRDFGEDIGEHVREDPSRASTQRKQENRFGAREN